MPATCCECIEVLCSIIFPPLGVFAKRGCGCDLLINILLTILGYFPGNDVFWLMTVLPTNFTHSRNMSNNASSHSLTGVLHAIYIICCTDPPTTVVHHVQEVHHVEEV